MLHKNSFSSLIIPTVMSPTTLIKQQKDTYGTARFQTGWNKGHTEITVFYGYTNYWWKFMKLFYRKYYAYFLPSSPNTTIYCITHWCKISFVARLIFLIFSGLQRPSTVKYNVTLLAYYDGNKIVFLLLFLINTISFNLLFKSYPLLNFLSLFEAYFKQTRYWSIFLS